MVAHSTPAVPQVRDVLLNQDTMGWGEAPLDWNESFWNTEARTAYRCSCLLYDIACALHVNLQFQLPLTFDLETQKNCRVTR